MAALHGTMTHVTDCWDLSYFWTYFTLVEFNIVPVRSKQWIHQKSFAVVACANTDGIFIGHQTCVRSAICPFYQHNILPLKEDKSQKCRLMTNKGPSWWLVGLGSLDRFLHGHLTSGMLVNHQECLNLKSRNWKVYCAWKPLFLQRDFTSVQGRLEVCEGLDLQWHE